MSNIIVKVFCIFLFIIGALLVKPDFFGYWKNFIVAMIGVYITHKAMEWY